MAIHDQIEAISRPQSHCKRYRGLLADAKPVYVNCANGKRHRVRSIGRKYVHLIGGQFVELKNVVNFDEGN
jgi:protein tyrosine/serine phosphatase